MQCISSTIWWRVEGGVIAEVVPLSWKSVSLEEKCDIFEWV